MSDGELEKKIASLVDKALFDVAQGNKGWFQTKSVCVNAVEKIIQDQRKAAYEKGYEDGRRKNIKGERLKNE